MKNRILMLLSLSTTLIFSSSCSTGRARIIPQADETIHSYGTSGYSQEDAYDAALDKAKDYCKDQGKQFAAVSESKNYKGIDKNVRAGLDSAGMILGSPEVAAVGRNSDDHEVTLVFKCK